MDRASDLLLPFDFPRIVDDMLTVGVVVVDRRFTVVVWNRFMELNSNVRADSVLGKNLFDSFPELNRNWLEKKIKSCLILKTASFSSWKQRPYVFRFKASSLESGEADAHENDRNPLGADAREDRIEAARRAFDRVAPVGLVHAELHDDESRPPGEDIAPESRQGFLGGLAEASGVLALDPERAGEQERWTRQIDGRVFRSHQRLGTRAFQALLAERFGPFEFGLAVLVADGRLSLVLRRWRAFGIPLWLWLGPKTEAFEHVEDGRFKFDVKIYLPGGLLLVHYRGWLAPA